ncbi:MAG: hypothetical protein ACRDPH_12365 [Marmoricola sp.]
MRMRNRRICRAAAGGAVVAALLPVGMAHLAGNTVPVTHAGETDVAVSITPAPTTLVLHDADVDLTRPNAYRFDSMQATLTSGGVAVQGVNVTFRVEHVPVCTATTGRDGGATCSPHGWFDRSLFQPAGADPTSYTATSAGTDTLGADTGSAHLAPVGADQEITGSADRTGQ